MMDNQKMVAFISTKERAPGVSVSACICGYSAHSIWAANPIILTALFVIYSNCFRNKATAMFRKHGMQQALITAMGVGPISIAYHFHGETSEYQHLYVGFVNEAQVTETESNQNDGGLVSDLLRCDLFTLSAQIGITG